MRQSRFVGCTGFRSCNLRQTVSVPSDDSGRPGTRGGSVRLGTDPQRCRAGRLGRVGQQPGLGAPMSTSRHPLRERLTSTAGKIITGVIIGVLVGVVLWSLGIGGGTPNALPSPTPTLPGQTPTPPTTSRQPIPSASPAFRWHGQITIGQTGVELDARPPTTSGSSATFNEIAGYLHPGNGQIAEWTRSSAPTPAQCHDWALSNSVQQLQVTSGMQLCVLTASQRTAYVVITSVSADGNSAKATATVWNQ
jgi:hypothetical protein